MGVPRSKEEHHLSEFAAYLPQNFRDTASIRTFNVSVAPARIEHADCCCEVSQQMISSVQRLSSRILYIGEVRLGLRLALSNMHSIFQLHHSIRVDTGG